MLLLEPISETFTRTHSVHMVGLETMRKPMWGFRPTSLVRTYIYTHITSRVLVLHNLAIKNTHKLSLSSSQTEGSQGFPLIEDHCARVNPTLLSIG